MVKITQKFLFLAIVLCLAAGSAGAEEDCSGRSNPS